MKTKTKKTIKMSDDLQRQFDNNKTDLKEIGYILASINAGIIDEHNSPVQLIYRLAHYALNITISSTHSMSLREILLSHQEAAYIRTMANTLNSLSSMETEDRMIGVRTKNQFKSYNGLVKEFSVYILNAIENQSDKLNMQGDSTEPNAMYISKTDFIELRNSVNLILEKS